MPKDVLQQQQQNAEVQQMPVQAQQVIEEQRHEAFLQEFQPDEKQMEFERQLQEQKEFLATSQDVQNLRRLNTYMENRSHQEWAQNYDEFAQLAGQLNQKFQTQYQYDTQHSNWAELEQQAQETLTQVMERDEEQQKVKQKTSFAGIEETMNAILADRNVFTDSGMYRGIRATCEKYKAEKVSLKKRLEILAELQTQVKAYTQIRYKKDGYGSKKGARRMGWMTKLLAMIASVQESSMPEIAHYSEQTLENNERRSETVDDMRKYHQDKFDKFRATGTKIPIERYADFLLYYKRDKNGEVTEETRANYEANLKTLDTLGNAEFTPENQEKRIGTLVKMFERMKKLRIDENSFTPEKAKQWFQDILDTEGFTTLYNNFNDLMVDERKRYQEHNMPVDPRITYMTQQTASQLVIIYTALTGQFLTTLGMKGNGDLDPSTDARKIKKMDEELSGQLAMYLNLAKETYEKGERTPEPDPEMEQKLQDTAAYYDNPEAYMKALTEKVAESRKKYQHGTAFVPEDLRSKYGDYFTVKGQQKLGIPNYYLRATDPGRIWNALDPYEKDAEGNVTPETMANYKQNDLIMKLAFSPNAEDRIAVMAKMYLRLGKIFEDGTPLTDVNILKAYEKDAKTNTMTAARNVLDDMLASELDRDADNELVKYMKKFSMSDTDAAISYVGQYIMGAQGYREDGSAFQGTEAELENFKMVQQMTKEGVAEDMVEKVEAEKQQNGGHLLKVDPVMEEKLKDLCRRKGLNFD